MGLQVTQGLDNTENVARADTRRLPPVDPKDWRTVANIRTVEKPVAEPAPRFAPKPRGIPQDTLRRLRYEVIEQTQPDGTSKYIHPIVDTRGDGVRSTLGVDRAHAGIPKGAESGGYGHGVQVPGEKLRGTDGRFTRGL